MNDLAHTLDTILTKYRDIEKNLESTLVTTFKSAKGLEFDTVIMPEFEHAERRDNNQYYVGSTRAKEKLYILCRSIPDVLENIDNTTPSVKASDGSTLFEGKGLNFVLSISKSISRSYHIFIAPAAPAPAPMAMIENIANTGFGNEGTKSIPVIAVKIANDITLGFKSSI